ncbi:MAG: hypothetical protein IJY80_00455, partial [Opitutales bacterium]|nr:hypothetical protein [Opitutales bacterium]
MLASHGVTEVMLLRSFNSSLKNQNKNFFFFCSFPVKERTFTPQLSIFNSSRLFRLSREPA